MNNAIKVTEINEFDSDLMDLWVWAESSSRGICRGAGKYFSNATQSNFQIQGYNVGANEDGMSKFNLPVAP